jgi:hypothetical protein
MRKVMSDSFGHFRVLTLFFLLSGLFHPGVAQELAGDEIKRCATMESYQHSLKNRGLSVDPLLLMQEEIGALVSLKRTFRTSETEIIRIPVVVHIVHDQESGRIGGRGNPNITDEQVLSQIRILNEDYRKMEGTPGYNTHPAGADTGIEFFLAEVDPTGAPSDGITRNYYASKKLFNPYTDAALLAEVNSWPSDEYMNIWVCALSGNYLGVAQFPSLTGIPGLDEADAARALTDGVIIDYKCFGDVGAIENNNYAQGRTTTHEVGHWFGLLHTWGDRRCGDDYCEDTPPAETSNTSSCNDRFSTCFGSQTRNMIENYMDYSPDRCMNIFTFNQMERIRAVMELSPRRIKLLENSRKARLEESERLQATVFPNPVRNALLSAEIRYQGYQNIDLTVVDLKGQVQFASRFENIWSRVFELPVEHLSSGVYFLVVTSESGEKVVRRFVVN